MIETGTLLQNRYLIEKQIGAGGMGAVYLAVDQRFGSYVAIKETFYTDEELGEAFEREARLLNSLFHPVLPHVSDYFTENNGYFLVMQYIEGEDLSAVLKRDGAFPVRDVLRWTNDLLDALDYLHSQEPPIIHRDIKPQNLKITPRGDIILLDFGLAKLKSEDTTGVRSVFGYSRRYSPLEQIQGTGTDARSDIFSLGATAYHLVTGRQPIDVLARASAIVAGNPDPLPPASEVKREIPLSVANVLKSALALNPAARFVSAKAMSSALENTFQDLEGKAEKASDPLPETAADNGVVISPNDEDFPALAAYVTGAADESRPLNRDQDTTADKSLTPPPAQTSLPMEKALNLPPVDGEVMTEAAPARKKSSRFLLPVLAALIICAGLAAGYFIIGSNSTNQSPDAQTVREINSDAGGSAEILDSPTPEIADSTFLNKSERAETNPISIEKVSEKKQTAVEPADTEETAEKTNPSSARTAIPRSIEKPRRSRPQQRQSVETRPRIIETQPLPDIESIFTGRSSRPRGENRRRQRGEEMSGEERRERRRQRREERRRQSDFPF